MVSGDKGCKQSRRLETNGSINWAGALLVRARELGRWVTLEERRFTLIRKQSWGLTGGVWSSWKRMAYPSSCIIARKRHGTLITGQRPANTMDPQSAIIKHNFLVANQRSLSATNAFHWTSTFIPHDWEQMWIMIRSKLILNMRHGIRNYDCRRVALMA